MDTETVNLFAVCKFCDEKVTFCVPAQADAEQIIYLFRLAMDSHLLVHVDQMVEISDAGH